MSDSSEEASAYERSHVATIAQRMQELENPLLQVVVGPRQTGKSTAIQQALERTQLPSHSVSADDLLAPTADWISQEWQRARNRQRLTGGRFVLVLDEIQKVSGWPNVVKGLWDADRRNGLPLKVVLSGSSSLLLRHGLEDSLKGGFELIRSPHWSLAECRDAFGYSLGDFLFYGGFPASALFVGDENRWRRYMRDSIVEPTITKDVLELDRVGKPELMRALFELGARYSGQELSYTKMLGQLQDAGNTTTLARYLTLLGKAGMLTGLPKYDPEELKRRRSSPRLMAYDPSLMTAMLGMPRSAIEANRELYRHVVESAAGAHLLAITPERDLSVSWWRDGNDEVDFVASDGNVTFGIEVKSGSTKAQDGMPAFLRQYPDAIRVTVGGSSTGAVALEEFLLEQSIVG